MLDIKFIREKTDLVKKSAKDKGYDVDIDSLLKLDDERRALIQKVDNLRAKRNSVAAESKGQKPTAEQIGKGKKLKEESVALESELDSVNKAFRELLNSVPNVATEDTPIGHDESANEVVYEWGEKPDFDFNPLNHWEIAEPRDWIDKDRAAKISGSRFAYIKGDLVLLQMSLMRFGMDVLTDEAVLKEIIATSELDVPSKPFVPVLPPLAIKTEPYQASGRLNAEETTYRLADDDLWLNASAEHSLCTMYMDEILEEKNLPLRYVGYATSFRREAGTYGKDMEGIVRMHQFDKLEMESFTGPENSLNEHLFFVAIQEYLMRQLKLPYRKLLKCTADIGFPNTRGVDLDVWLPGQSMYRETHTADYMTDFQARGTKTRVRKSDDEIVFAHTNDATAFSQRPLIAILENYQTKEGKVLIPEVLKKYMGGRDIL